jgi:hypothetical protein
MERIPVDKLREMWKREGIHGDWRNILKKDYKPGELYFEFGLMPEKHHKCNYRIILDHEVRVLMCPKYVVLQGEYVIRPDNTKAGEVEVLESDKAKGFRYHTFYVTDEDYREMINDATRIYEEYRDEVIVCFWSIPNRWFSDLSLVRFITGHIVLSQDYRNRRRSSRLDWYWP